MERRIGVLINPASGAGRRGHSRAAVLSGLASRGDRVRAIQGRSAEDAERLLAEAMADGLDVLVAVGGDGTVHQALQHVVGTRTALGIVPLGTGNDFATALGIPDDLDQAIDTLGRAESRQIDLGRLDDQYFVNVSAGGFIAEVSDAVSTQLKTIAGKLAYLIGGAQVLMRHEPIVAHYRTGSAAGHRSTLETFAVCNSRLIGGGRLIAPDAVLDDGELDVCLIEDMPPVEFIALLRRVSAGEHIADERVRYFRTSELQMTFDRRVKVNVDGQVLETERCSYSVLPRAVRFLSGR